MEKLEIKDCIDYNKRIHKIVTFVFVLQCNTKTAAKQEDTYGLEEKNIVKMTILLRAIYR